MDLIQEADRSKWMMHSNHNTRCFTEGDIERMTNNNRSCLGRGAFGEVYEGTLEDGSMVAVKRLIGSMKENFAKEFIVHREINHKNVVRLIGYCIEENVLMLVMEYIANGNLNDVLHDGNGPIPLDIRLRIAIECAEALAYMHSHMYTQVIHGDIKPGNILLDRNFHAKLSDFGISRVANTDETLYTKNVIGSIGYMDPLFSMDGRITVKYDVYSFGVVLVELITRKKAVAENVNNVYAFNNALTRGVRGVRKMFDVDIASKNNLKVLEGVAKLAGECLRMDREKRPKMVDVVECLQVLRKSSHQDQGRRNVDMFSWVRKSYPAPPPSMSKYFKQNHRQLLQQLMSQNANIAERMIIPMEELAKATNNFDKDRELGSGGHGTVYKGILSDQHHIVAIKKSRITVQKEIDQFINEITILSQVNHKNIIKFFGCCLETKVPLLVYEFMPNGTLYHHLHEGPWSLSWGSRLRIAAEIASSLAYIHTTVSIPVIHRDIKSQNILLDDTMTSKISDFGASRYIPFGETGLTTGVQGTIGYLDPMYFHTGRLTEKIDVYSFGVVLVELLTRKKPSLYLSTEGDNLASHFLNQHAQGNLVQIMDPQVIEEGGEEVQEVAALAVSCINLRVEERPTMRQVEHTLVGIPRSTREMIR